MMNSAPSPVPAEQKCPNCGTMAPLDYALCPRCGMQLSAPSKAIYGCASLLFQGFLGVLALLFGASGACVALIAALGAADGGYQLIVITLVLFLLTYGCIWGIIRISRSQK